MTDEEGRQEEVSGVRESHLSVVPDPVHQSPEEVTVVERDLQVTMSRPTSDGSQEAEPVASVVRLPLVSPPKDRVRSLLQRLETLERGLAEVRARLDLVSPLGTADEPDDKEASSTPHTYPSDMSEAEKEDVFLGLQRLVLDRLRRAEEPD
jgi:hypothetical protein